MSNAQPNTELTRAQIIKKYNLVGYRIVRIIEDPTQGFPPARRGKNNAGVGRCDYFNAEAVDNWFKLQEKKLNKSSYGLDNTAALAFITKNPAPHTAIDKAIARNAPRVRLYVCAI
jgi:hypothetical protein